MSINLPKPIAAYFAAENAKDAGAVAKCFAVNGILRDEGHTYKGTHAIAFPKVFPLLTYRQADVSWL